MTKAEELSAMTGNEVKENTQLANVEQVEGTPFTIVESEGNCFLALGKYRLTETGTKEDTLRQLENVYDITLKMIHIVHEYYSTTPPTN
ncbi:MAG: hypothetical protein [Microviridae sp.]|nr:MAG: hypothetical protein [Microviridae sp.]